MKRSTGKPQWSLPEFDTIAKRPQVREEKKRPSLRKALGAWRATAGHGRPRQATGTLSGASGRKIHMRPHGRRTLTGLRGSASDRDPWVWARRVLVPNPVLGVGPPACNELAPRAPPCAYAPPARLLSRGAEPLRSNKFATAFRLSFTDGVVEGTPMAGLRCWVASKPDKCSLEGRSRARQNCRTGSPFASARADSSSRSVAVWLRF